MLDLRKGQLIKITQFGLGCLCSIGTEGISNILRITIHVNHEDPSFLRIWGNRLNQKDCLLILSIPILNEEECGLFVLGQKKMWLTFKSPKKGTYNDFFEVVSQC